VAREPKYEERGDQDDPDRYKCDAELSAADWFGLDIKLVT
jgi:hypothetical protein